MGLFVLWDWGRNFERKAWKVGTNEPRSLMGRATKEQGRPPAGSNTETSVSHRTERTQTFGGHMVLEISSQFQTIWWIELTLLLNSLSEWTKAILLHRPCLTRASAAINVWPFLRPRFEQVNELQWNCPLFVRSFLKPWNNMFDFSPRKGVSKQEMDFVF